MELNAPAHSSDTTARALRWAAAVALLIGGLVHLQLYFASYRSYPDANLGRSFVLNAIASAVIAALLVFRSDRLIRLGGIAVAVGTLVAFFISRSSDLLFGFEEKGLEPSPQAATTLVVEILAIVLLGATFVPRIDRLSPTWSIGPALAVVAVVAVVVGGFGAYWARDYGRESDAASGEAPATTAAPTADAPGAPTDSAAVEPGSSSPSDGAATAEGQAVSIIDFAFAESALTVPVGATVTWTNADTPGHSVVADDASFASEKMSTGDVFDHTFDQAGEFAYICGIHPSMKGSITVAG